MIAGTLSAINFLLPFFLQNLLGYSPSQVGWIIVADSVIIMIMAPIAGSLSDRFGSRLLCTIGCAIVTVAQFFLATLDLNASLPRIMLPLVVWGVGWALFNAPNQSSILGAVSPEKIGAVRRHDRDNRAHRRRHGCGVVGDLVRLSFVGRRFKRRPNRIARKLARCAGNLHGRLFNDNFCFELLYPDCGVVFRRQRREPASLIDQTLA